MLVLSVCTRVCVCVCVSHSVVFDSAIPRAAPYLAPLSIEFSRQEYYSGCYSFLQFYVYQVTYSS